MKKEANKKRSIAILQIVNIFLSIIAFSFLISLTNIEIISATSWYDYLIENGAVVKENNLGIKVLYTPDGRELGTENYIKSLGEYTSGVKNSALGGLSNTPKPVEAPPIWKRIYGFGEARTPKGELIGTGADKWTFAQGNFVDGIVSSASYGLTAYLIVKSIAPMFGLEDEQVDAAATAAGFGFFVGRGVQLLAQKNKLWMGELAKGIGVSSGTLGWIVGGGTAILILYNMWEDEDTKTVTYECDPWEPPLGGHRCEECNKQGILPCSEYQCRSLGQACELLNPGTNEELCTWKDRKDVKPPVITPWEDALQPDYKYRPDKRVSPPDRGAIIWNEKTREGCAPAFTPLSFGVTTDEPSQCKLDTERKRTYDEMEFYLGGSSTFKYNHSQGVSLPSVEALEAENLTLRNDGNFELFVRCIDANGNLKPDSPSASFVFRYCVEKGPDTTPPLIVTTNLLNGMPIAHGTDTLDIELYVNEPADCKWSHLDQSYDSMENTMSCSSSIFEMNAQMLYKCSSTLDGIKDEQENNFYFRCRDKPLSSKDRNTNTESYVFTVIGTRPLVIDSISPDKDVMRDSTEAVKVTLEVETIAGYKDGEATCYYSETENEGDYIMFYYEEGTSSHYHTQELWLPEGNYKYYIKCLDLGGNTDYGVSEFRVETDTEAPKVVRAFRDSDYLKIITSEEGDCVYSNFGCNYQYEEGTQMSTVADVNGDEIEHFTSWDTTVDFYIKCQDSYGNKPNPSQCSIIARPFEIYEIQG